MALVGKGEVPSDGVSITEEEAIRIQWEMVHDWKPRRDVWALIYGPGILATAGGLTGYVFSRHYRSKLKLKSYGHFSTYFPLVIMPALFSAFFHRMFVSSNILIQNEPCVICTETRAAALQVGIGVVYPLILAPAACYMLANRYNTVRMPSLFAKKIYWEFHLNNSRSLYKKVPYFLGIHVFLATALAYWDFKNFFKVNERVAEIEEEMIKRGVPLD